MISLQQTLLMLSIVGIVCFAGRRERVIRGIIILRKPTQIEAGTCFCKGVVIFSIRKSRRCQVEK